MDCDELSMALPRYPNGPKADPMKPDYANPDFWDARFQDTEGLFDWYATYDELNDTFEEFCPIKSHCEDSLLVVGCGQLRFLCRAAWRWVPAHHQHRYLQLRDFRRWSSSLTGQEWLGILSQKVKKQLSQLFDFPWSPLAKDINGRTIYFTIIQ